MATQPAEECVQHFGTKKTATTVTYYKHGSGQRSVFSVVDVRFVLRSCNLIGSSQGDSRSQACSSILLLAPSSVLKRECKGFGHHQHQRRDV
ncbi:unnamed protein product [Arabidopsis thaliana]|uniref:(thale cress) hypothetical protein n=1 Tax=Arabidopsis thaliana TaxID=3702 RepID=A0A7G2E7Z1_ARATH|nr:unnamed protein product [Arabidopsis thaliana]